MAKHRKFAVGDTVAILDTGQLAEIVRYSQGYIPTVQIKGGSRIDVWPSSLTLVQVTNRPN